MRYLSVCSGIEAASVAWHPLGWESVAFAEIDPFPSAVLAHHFPGVPNLGDFTTIDTRPGDADLLVGGTPCQSFSVAGRRAGLDDPRGILAFEFLRLAGRVRPSWVVFENVPGLLSSNGGRDFGAFLGGLGELGYGWSYRVLDSIHFGVPQRRRRVFVVGYLGDWRRAAAVLFERDCLSGHPPTSRKAEPGVAPSVTPGARRASGNRSGEQLTVARALTGHHGRIDGDTENFIAHTLRADGFDASVDGTGRGTPLVPVAYQCHGNNVGPMGTIRSGNAGPTGGVPFVVNSHNGTAKRDHARPSDVARCLDETGGFPPGQGGTVIAFQERGREGGRNIEWQEGTSYALRAIEGGGCGDWFRVAHRMAVRRLTPRECERLQGFPDDWSLVPYRGKPAADGPRYRALGNSMAVPVVRWIGERIDLVDSLPA